MSETETMPVPGQTMRCSLEKCAEHGVTLFTHHLERREDGTAQVIFACQACWEAEQDADA